MHAIYTQRDRGSTAKRGRFFSVRVALLHLIVVTAMLVPAQTALAWKPFMHNGLADFARQDAIDDGRIQLNGKSYAVRPEIVAALKAWPAYYNAGVIGPDGYPDLTYGQSVIHPEGSGKWLRHIYQRAWDAQRLSTYTAAEKQQILAFAYGYLTHGAGDMWAHTLVNEYAEGVFPGVKDIITEEGKMEVALRHLIIEGYIGQAYAGYDNNPDRTQLPDGDWSDDSTPARAFAVPTRFVYETLVDPNADVPVNSCTDNVDDDLDGVVNDGCPGKAGAFSPDGGHWAYDDNDADSHDGEHGSPVDGAEVKRGPLLDFFIYKKADLEVARAKYRADRDHQDCALIDPDCFEQTSERTVMTVRGAMTFDYTRNECIGAQVGCAPDPSDTVDVALNALVITYLNAWIEDIDDGIKAWPELGDAITRAMFDPQARRNAQNDICRNRGTDNGDPNSVRGKCEDRIGTIDVVLHEASPFITNHLLSMAGLPDAVGGGIEVLNGLSEIFDDLLGPALNPLRKTADVIKEEIKQYIYKEVNSRYGIDIEAAAPFFRNATNWLTVNEPITVRMQPRLDSNGLPMWEDYVDPDTGAKRRRPALDPVELQLFTNRQHERVDALLRLPPNHHVPAAPPHNVSYLFPNGLPASTRLADGVSFNPMQVAPARNTIIMSKLLLLDGAELNRVLGDTLQTNGVINTVADVRTYGTNSATYPANIMLDGLTNNPAAGASPFETWLKSIDSDHAWRQDGLPVFCDGNPILVTPDPYDGTCVRSAANPSREDNKPTPRFRQHRTDTEWENGGNGNFPLWESCLLRPAFRGIFTDWENGSFAPASFGPQNFPDHGDAPRQDVSTTVIPQTRLSLSGANYASGTTRFIGPDHRFIIGTTETVFAPAALKIEYRVYKVGATPPEWTAAFGSANFALPADATQGQWVVEHRLTTPCNTLDTTDDMGRAPTVGETFVLDKAVPANMLDSRHAPNSAGWTRGDTRITITGTDGNGSGMKEVRYSATGAQTIAATTVPGTTASFTIATEGTTTITFSTVDNLGLVTPAKTYKVRIDRGVPTSQQTAPAAGATVKGQVPLAVSASDGVGVAGVRFLINDLPVAQAANAPYARDWNSATTFDGRKVLSSCVTDTAGNVAAGPLRTINVDNIPGTQTPPVHTAMVSPSSQWASEGQQPAVSYSGRYVAFTAGGNDAFLPGDTNNRDDIYVRDRDSDNDGIFDEPDAVKYARVSLGVSGAQGNANSQKPAISGDGRFVAFESYATNLVPADTNGVIDIFLHDRDADADGIFDEQGATLLRRVSVSTAGAEGTGPNRNNINPMISADGRFVTFDSPAENLVPGDTLRNDVFVYDVQKKTLAKASVTAKGEALDGSSEEASISADGRFIAFVSTARNIVDDGSVQWSSVIVHDRDSDRDGVYDEPNAMRNSVMNMTPYGVVSEETALFNRPMISGDGRFVTFVSQANDLVPYDANGTRGDVFVRDRDTDADGVFDEPAATRTELVSVSTCGVQANASSGTFNYTSISADGRFIAFYSEASNLVAEDTASDMDIFLRDRVAGTTQRMSVSSTGVPATWRSVSPAISGNGAFVVYDSFVQLTPDDINTSDDDIYATKREVLAPDTTITSGPSGTTTATQATFTFSTTEAGSTFTCSLDGKPFERCQATKNYSGLTKGQHTLDVRATDASSNTDATPVRRIWTIN